MSAGYAAGVPRLGVPAQLQTDASMGVTNPGYRPDDTGATAFPSSRARLSIWRIYHCRAGLVMAAAPASPISPFAEKSPGRLTMTFEISILARCG